jgi:hypothetical protein
MATDFVFNELSLGLPYPDIFAAHTAMDNFIAVLKASRDASFGVTLRIPMEFWNLLLAANYPIAAWYQDQSVSREKRLFIGTLSTKSPFFEGLLNNHAADEFDRSEFLMDGAQSGGLGVAYLINGIGISLSTLAPWDRDYVRITFRTLNSLTVQVEDELVEVGHVSNLTHVNFHAVRLRNLRISAINTGSGLWDARSELFERLDFCDSVREQIHSLTTGTGGLSIVCRTFGELQAYFESWQGGQFDSRMIPHTTRESETALQQFPDERTFSTPSGKRELFSWHVKRGHIRIYFTPDAATKRCLIGYVGAHLRTAQFRN